MSWLKTTTFSRLYLSLIFIMSIYCIVIGLVAYFSPEYFFSLAASHTGDFNPHLVKDVGAAFLTSGVMLILGFKISRWRTPCVVSGSLFLSLHGLIHWHDLFTLTSFDYIHVLSEVATVLLPATVLLLAIIYDWYHIRR